MAYVVSKEQDHIKQMRNLKQENLSIEKKLIVI